MLHKVTKSVLMKYLELLIFHKYIYVRAEIGWDPNQVWAQTQAAQTINL